MTNAEAAVMYARYVLKRRWKQAEPTIKQSPNFAKEYNERFFKKGGSL
jgi:hypothetical protein